MWAGAAAGMVLLWQFVTVQYNFQGNWTALFCTGSRFEVPPALAREQVFQFPGSSGYDGQFYHYIAHDPFFRHGLVRYVDAPQLRYTRILVPGLAFMLAAGCSRYVDAAYIGVVLSFVFLGVWWAGRYALLYGWHPAWALGFLALPATVSSFDKLTVDVAMAALTAGFAWYTKNDRRKLVLVLCLAPLVRETGFLLILASGICAAIRRRWREVVLFSAAALPSCAWYLFLTTKTEWRPYQISLVPFVAMVKAIVHPLRASLPPVLAQTVITLDYLALAGTLIGLGLAVRLAVSKSWDPVTMACLLFAVLGLALSREDVWQTVFGHGRILSPLLLLLALGALEHKDRSGFLPLLLVTPRTAVQLGPQVLGVLRGMFSL